MYNQLREGVLIETLFIPNDNCNVIAVQQFVHPDAVEFFCKNVLGMSEVGECLEAFIVPNPGAGMFMNDINEIVIWAVAYGA